MKAQELLKRYAEGRRDFRGENLRGLSFKGKDLSGADFSETDIRGTNFSRANLTGAKFVEAKAGLQKRRVIGLLIFCCLLSGVLGSYIYFLAYFMTLIFYDKPSNIIGWISLFITFSLNFILIYRGFNAVAFAFTAFAFSVAGAVTVAFAFAGALTLAVAVVFAVAGAFAGALTFVFAGTFAFVFAGTFAFVTRAVPVAFIFAVAGAFVAGAFVTRAVVGAFVAGAFAAFAVTIILILFYSYIGWRTIKGDSKYILIRENAVAFVATDGTTFNDATLTDADFTKATLKNTDFRKARLTRTCFRETKKLDLARPGNTYLKTMQIQELVQTGQGKDKNFDRQDLQGLYLKEAKLADASFIGANLNQTNFQDADLSRAKLVQTKLDQTNFTGAILTGAYIEDWNITRSTKFDNVKCEYVYMRLPM